MAIPVSLPVSEARVWHPHADDRRLGARCIVAKCATSRQLARTYETEVRGRTVARPCGGPVRWEPGTISGGVPRPRRVLAARRRLPASTGAVGTMLDAARTQQQDGAMA